MSGAIEDIAKKWLSEPAYTKVFKHTADVIEDYLCYLLTALGAIALSVRFLSSLGTGDLSCVITGVSTYNATTSKDLGPYPSGATLSLVNFANFNQDCIDEALTVYMQYLPFVLLIQAVSIIFIEKLLMKFPRVSGKIERFYGTIVEESLFGKDPDVAEDVQDTKANAELIARRRRRNEVCMSLKRSNIIHKTYIIKNILEIIILSAYIPLNLYFTWDSLENLEPSKCSLNILQFPELGIHEEGKVFYHCEAKKVRFFLVLQYVQLVALGLVLLCSLGSLTWCLWFRSISKLLEKMSIQRLEKKERDDLSNGMNDETDGFIKKNREDSWDIDIDISETNNDFVFLFDLLAHTAGVESTLRVLTHADETFRKICLPKLKAEHDVKVSEDRLTIKWKPASLEYWLESNQHKGIVVDSYDVTIFPAESMTNSVTKLTDEKDSSGSYSTKFIDLHGGKTEYIVTIACVIGKSRMKGERIVTNLLPHGPEKPHDGRICKNISTKEIEIEWEKPKEGFTKYVLRILSIDNNSQDSKPIFTPHPSRIYKDVDNIGSTSSLGTATKGKTEKELLNSLTSYITGLSPGEAYKITLMTKTGDRKTNNPIEEMVMTTPEKVKDLQVDPTSMDCTQAVVKWLKPIQNHSKLRAFNLILASNDGKYKVEAAAMTTDKHLQEYKFDNLSPAMEYTLSVRTVCVQDMLRTVSDEEQIIFATLPEPPTNLSLKSRFPNSLTENSVYKVNVFAIVYDSDEKEVESKELHEKVILSEDNKLMLFSEEDKTSVSGEGQVGPLRQLSVQQ